MDRRIGTFHIDVIFPDNDPAMVRNIMGQCIILRAESRMEYHAIEYTAICPQFDLLPDGYLPPRYEWVSTLEKMEFGSRMKRVWKATELGSFHNE